MKKDNDKFLRDYYIQKMQNRKQMKANNKQNNNVIHNSTVNKDSV